jgi:hypothetical protein
MLYATHLPGVHPRNVNQRLLAELLLKLGLDITVSIEQKTIAGKIDPCSGNGGHGFKSDIDGWQHPEQCMGIIAAAPLLACVIRRLFFCPHSALFLKEGGE